MPTVKVTGNGERPITETDLLAFEQDLKLEVKNDFTTLERDIRRYFIMMGLAFLGGAFGFGAYIGTLRRDVDVNEARIAEIRAEGSIPVQELSRQLAILSEQVKQYNERVASLTSLVMKNEAALVRIETRLRR